MRSKLLRITAFLFVACAPVFPIFAEDEAEAEVETIPEVEALEQSAESSSQVEEPVSAEPLPMAEESVSAGDFSEAEDSDPSERQLGRVIVVPSSEAKSIGRAMAAARVGDTVRVRKGTYREKNIFVAPGVVFQSEELFKAVLDGRGRNTVVTMGNASVIEGFEIRNGSIGIMSAASQAVIRRCRIIHNVQSGVMCVGVLPKMEDNFIVFNRGSGIQGWDVRTTSGSINHNTIAFNGNHGISLGGNTSITVENNIIAFNSQFGVKPGEETVRVELINNNLYQNARISLNIPSDNISADPLFVDAKRFDFSLLNGSRSIGMGTDNQNLGARILH